MKLILSNTRKLGLIAALLLLLALFGYVAVRSGPMASIPVTVARVSDQRITPALFGIGTVDARYTYLIGPIAAGRVRQVYVQVGDHVRAGQLIAEMDPVDLDNRVAAQQAALQRAQSAVQAATAQLEEAAARQTFAQTQARRYAQLLQARSTSVEILEAKLQEQKAAEAGFAAASANLAAARQDITRIGADRDGLLRQRSNLRLTASVDGLVVARNAEPGTTVVAGQAVVQIIDPASVWLNVRFDQLHASGLRAGLPAAIVLHSQAQQNLPGRVMRIEPLADAVTEEILAKVTFDRLPKTLPPIGELAEVTVALPALAATPVVPNAALKRIDGKTGVWLVKGTTPDFVPVRTGASDLDGRVQIVSGLKAGDRIVVYSQREIGAHSRIKIVDHLAGGTP